MSKQTRRDMIRNMGLAFAVAPMTVITPEIVEAAVTGAPIDIEPDPPLAGVRAWELTVRLEHADMRFEGFNGYRVRTAGQQIEGWVELLAMPRFERPDWMPGDRVAFALPPSVYDKHDGEALVTIPEAIITSRCQTHQADELTTVRYDFAALRPVEHHGAPGGEVIS